MTAYERAVDAGMFALAVELLNRAERRRHAAVTVASTVLWALAVVVWSLFVRAVFS